MGLLVDKNTPHFQNSNKATLLDNTSETARGAKPGQGVLEYIHSPSLPHSGVARVSVVPESLHESFLFRIISCTTAVILILTIFFSLKKKLKHQILQRQILFE